MEVSATDMRGTLISSQAAAVAPRPAAGHADSGPAGDGVSAGDAQMRQMVEQMQSHLDSMNVSLKYSFYGKRGEKLAVQVVNRETGEVIREIPAKEMQTLQMKMSELVGMIFNDQA